MNKILVTYATNAGSTAKVAQAVADELAKNAAGWRPCRSKKSPASMAIPPFSAGQRR
jgi:flavodoxin